MQHEYDATFTDEHGTDEQGTSRLLGIHIPFNNASGKTVASESTRL
jgi:hypothetical protein